MSTLGCDRGGSLYNINGDTAAACIAGALRAERLLLMTDVPGILRDKNDPESLLPDLTVDEARQARADGILAGGMIPKVDCAVQALEAGVENVVILDGRVPHALLLELLTDEGAGTLLRKDFRHGAGRQEMDKTLQQIDHDYIANTYNRYPVEIVSGKGAIATDETGREYIDMGAGIGVTSFGYCDPVWQAAVTAQLGKVQHTSNLYYTEPGALLARELCRRTGLKKAFSAIPAPRRMSAPSRWPASTPRRKRAGPQHDPDAVEQFPRPDPDDLGGDGAGPLS